MLIWRKVDDIKRNIWQIDLRLIRWIPTNPLNSHQMNSGILEKTSLVNGFSSSVNDVITNFKVTLGRPCSLRSSSRTFFVPRVKLHVTFNSCPLYDRYTSRNMSDAGLKDSSAQPEIGVKVCGRWVVKEAFIRRQRRVRNHKVEEERSGREGL